MPLISVTRLRIRAHRYLPAFFWYAMRASRQARRVPGCLAVKLLGDVDHTYWTNTAWKDEAAMRAYMISGPHRRAMPRLLKWCDEASLVHWEQPTAELPDWQEAHRRLLSHGRRSKVHHPSARHLSHDIPPPVT